jgi:hypothetical protein
MTMTLDTFSGVSGTQPALVMGKANTLRRFHKIQL